MPRGVVWYLAGSPVMPLLSGLPRDLEPRPLPARDAPVTGPEEGAVLVVDLGGGDSGAVADAAARLWDVPIVALVDAAAQDAPPQACYAYLTKPVTPFILATALRNAGEHARLGREAGEARRQLEELNAIGVRLSAERDTAALPHFRFPPARQSWRTDAYSLYPLASPEDGPRRLRFKRAARGMIIARIF